MNLRLVRRWFTDESTIGELDVDGSFLCYILEDPIAQAIPGGTYRVQITYSPRFHRMLPLIEDVPGREGIRIHPGNTAADTTGCLLPGMERGENIVRRSREAFALLFESLAKTQAMGAPAFIVISAQP